MVNSVKVPTPERAHVQLGAFSQNVPFVHVDYHPQDSLLFSTAYFPCHGVELVWLVLVAESPESLSGVRIWMGLKKAGNVPFALCFGEAISEFFIPH